MRRDQVPGRRGRSRQSGSWHTRAVHAVVCPDKFRGSLSSRDAADRIAAGFRAAGIDRVTTAPMADGGEGTLDALLATPGSRRLAADTVDATGVPLQAAWGLLADGTAVVEAATSVGLALLGERRDPVGASSLGVGRVIAQALDQRPRRLLVAVGGVASTDGGLGLLEAIGWDLRGVDTVVACDVTTRFVDAARVFAPQKGADAAQVRLLTERLERLAEVYAERARDISELPGAGAAGGIAGGLAAVGARLEPGFGLVADLVGLPAKVAGADVVATGEGRLDATSLHGKVVGGTLALPMRPGTARVVLAGVADGATAEGLRRDGVVVRTVRALAANDADSFARAGELLVVAARDTAQELLASP